MTGARVFLIAALLAPAWGGELRLRPPLWIDNDRQPAPAQGKQQASELNAILYNTWLRHLDGGYKAVCARDNGALSVNAWDEAPDSSWFTNRIGRGPLAFAEILRGLAAKPPAPPPWTVTTVIDEGYTPKLDILDSEGLRYIVKFDPPPVERNSAAERISTLAFYAAGYNVPRNTITYFRAEDIRLDPQAVIRNAVGKKLPMTPTDLAAVLARVKPLSDGRYRALASFGMDGVPAGKFRYSGTREGDPNDIIPHELRRELRGLYVIASWLNHADCGDKNTWDAYEGESGKGFIRHYLMDFGSTLGAGDFVNGPYRVGHEHVFDGAAMGRSFLTLGIWRRPWDVQGRIRFPEVGYFDSELFDPRKWKPNYPNLAFARRDDADSYWGAKIVTAFNDELIQRLAQAGEYSRPEAAAYVADTLKRRRDAIGAYWFDRITPLEDFVLDGDRLTFRDIAVERGYAKGDSRTYRIRALSAKAASEFTGFSAPIPDVALPPRPADRYGRTLLTAVRIQSKNRSGWALPVEIILGRNGDGKVQALGWSHAAR